MRRNRSSTLHPHVIADAWQAIGQVAADFEARKKAVAVDQMASVISNYSERASSPRSEGYLTPDEVGYLAATDVRLHFWAARSLEVEVPLALFSSRLGPFLEPEDRRTAMRDGEEQGSPLVERLAAS